MEQDKVTKLSSESRKNVWDEDDDGGKTMKQDKKKKESFGQRWDRVQPTKTVVFWSWVAVIVLTMIVGFNWGGWVTGGTAEVMAKDAVVQRLALVCVGQFNQDLGKIQKLRELKETSAYRRDDYVKDQGWATMPGEEKPDRKVADECAKLLVQSQ